MSEWIIGRRICARELIGGRRWASLGFRAAEARGRALLAYSAYLDDAMVALTGR